MAFWDAWFKPNCDGCGKKIVDHPPYVHPEGKLCYACQEEWEALQEYERKEVEARRQAQHAAMARMEGKKKWGSDPRFDQD